MRLALFAAAVLLAAAPSARAKARTARQDFRAGIEAHLKGDDAAAARAWASCAGKAVKGSDDESDCRLFSGMLREELAPNAPVPDKNGAARRAYVEGRDVYLRGDLKGADRLWHDCLSASERDPASRPDCLERLKQIEASSTAPDGKK